MVQAVLNKISLDDYRGPDHWFDDPRDFCVIVDLQIADKEMDGGDLFSLTVCSLKWFDNNVIHPPVQHASHDHRTCSVFGRHHLFVDQFDEAEIEKTVRELICSIRGDDWSDVAQKLSRYFRWEFEDCKKSH
ncbi:Imm8 family immunity protein [uncultured Litoreibacter sp.]|uniref:Imm8 family immunity protein n=1 Tax=uncultured Litoreibacter sp. TaxID=1392394 RepID=UPI0026187FFC|nr:Imm8 family immunity protein [uncultured Litoreibacter sp.]